MKALSARGRRRRVLSSRELAIIGIHLTVLWSLAFAQPLLDLLGDSPEFFVARENTRGDILILAFAVTFLPPLALTALEAVLARISPGLRRGFHLVLVAVLVAAFALQLLKDNSGGTAAVLLPVALGFGLLAALAYARTRFAPMLLTALSPAPVLFVLTFLAFSPVSKLVLGDGEVATADVAVRGEAPVVMIVFDEFSGFSLMGRDRRIDAARYPNFARLAGDATWYRNATTVADFTDRAVPALLTGELPERGAAPIASDHPESLFTLLGGTYSFDVREPVTDVCPDKLCPREAGEQLRAQTRLRELASDLSVVSLHLLLPDDLSDDLPAVDRSFGDFGGDPDDGPAAGGLGRGFAAFGALARREQELRDFERQLGRAPPDRAHLSFLHLELPHHPYEFLPTGQRYLNVLGEVPGVEASELVGGTWRKDRRLVRQGFQRYLLQVGYADHVLGRVLARLRAAGLYEGSLVVVTADHGVSFQPGRPVRAVTESTLPEIAGVPVLVKDPGQREGRIDDASFNLTDVLPTIAAGLGVRLPWETDGRAGGRVPRRDTVSVQPQEGENASIPFAEFVDRRNELVDRMLREFGDGPEGLFRSGLDDDLIGERIDSLPAAPPAGARFEVEGSGLLSSVDPNGPNVPALIAGRVSGIPAGARLAVAVAGRVASVTVPFSDGGVRRFVALVPPRAFAPGANAVEALAVTSAGAGRRLRRLRGGLLEYRLVKRDGRMVIVDGSGGVIAIVPGALDGSVDALTIDEAQAKVEGWAGDTKRSRPAQLVVAFAGDRLLAAGRPELPQKDVAKRFGRPQEDVAKRFGSGLAKSGFKLTGWTSGPKPGSARAPVSVFAVSGRRASLLPLP